MDDRAALLATMPPRGDVFNARCPTRRVLSHVTGRWGGLVLGALNERTKRFAELRRQIGGISEKMLAQTLKDLERDGLVERRSFPVVPPHVEYSLTPIGRECARRLWDLAHFIEDNLEALVCAQWDHDERLQACAASAAGADGDRRHHRGN